MHISDAVGICRRLRLCWRPPGGNPGAGAGVSGAPREGDRAVLAGRRRRRADAGDRAGIGQADGPAGGRREQAGRRRDDRQRDRRPRGARRLHAAARLADQCDQRVALPQARVRSDRGLRADLAHRRGTGRARRQSGASGEDVAGIHCLREGAPRPGRLRIVGQRQRPAPLRRAPRVVDRSQDEPHPLQGKRAGDDRSPRRPSHGVDSGNGRHGGPHQGGQASRARGDRGEALAAAARRPDGDGVRRAGLRGVRVDGPARPEGNPAGDRRPAVPRARRRARHRPR